MKIIITVVGNDKVGIVAAVSQKLSELQVNIIDMSQTLMHGSFTMMLMGELNAEADFASIKKELSTVGEQIGVSIHVENQELFGAMQNI